MARPIRALLVLGLICAVNLAGALTGAGTASATALPIGQCTTTSGVVLAVDFAHWGGPVLRACGSTPTTGYALLNQGGWASTGTQHDGPGFICRISYSGFHGGTGYPTDQKCVNTPPTTAYWSYWHANPGQSNWTYSQDGAASYSPAAGSVELWTFGGASSSSRPSISPDAVRAHNSTPPAASTTAPRSSLVPVRSTTPSAVAGPPGLPPAAGGTTTAAGSTTSPGAGSDAEMPRRSLPVPSHSGRRPGNAASSGGKAVASATASTVGSASAAPSVIDAQPVAAIRHRAGSALPGLLTAALVLALGGAAGVTAWRRRQAR